MSGDNVRLVRAIYEMAGETPLEARPEAIDEAFRELVHPQFEIHLPPDYPEGELVFRGRDGFARLRAMLADTWSDWAFRPERFVDAGDHVVVYARIVGHGEASHVPVDLETTHLWTIASGRAQSVHAFRDRSEALKAAGLSE
jgi:ketosteroid isomerase-like protein